MKGTENSKLKSEIVDKTEEVNALRTEVLNGAIQTHRLNATKDVATVRSYNSSYLDSIVGNKNLSFASSTITG